MLPSLSGPYYSELLAGFWSTSAEFGQSITVMSAREITDLETRVLDLAGKVDGMVIGHATVDDDVVTVGGLAGAGGAGVTGAAAHL